MRLLIFFSGVLKHALFFDYLAVEFAYWNFRNKCHKYRVSEKSAVISRSDHDIYLEIVVSKNFRANVGTRYEKNGFRPKIQP